MLVFGLVKARARIEGSVLFSGRNKIPFLQKASNKQSTSVVIEKTFY